MSRLGGLWRAMPWTASLFALGAVAISGLPPLNGFVSEWLVYLGMFDAVNQPGAAVVGAIPAIVLLAMTGALALACFVKVCGVVFLGAPRSPAAEHAHECGPWMRGPDADPGGGVRGHRPGAVRLLAGRAYGGGCVAGHVDGRPGAGIIDDARPGSHGVGRVGGRGAAWLWRRAHRGGWARAGTWDCGYAAPTARMQYTAGSFAGIITEWFAWILQPERHEHRPEAIVPAAGSL